MREQQAKRRGRAAKAVYLRKQVLRGRSSGPSLVRRPPGCLCTRNGRVLVRAVQGLGVDQVRNPEVRGRRGYHGHFLAKVDVEVVGLVGRVLGRAGLGVSRRLVGNRLRRETGAEQVSRGALARGHTPAQDVAARLLHGRQAKLSYAGHGLEVQNELHAHIKALCE